MNETEIKDLPFEEALRELESIVRELESGNQNLDDSIKKYERGSELKKHCESKLKDAKLKVEKITEKPDKNVTTENFAAE